MTVWFGQGKAARRPWAEVVFVVFKVKLNVQVDTDEVLQILRFIKDLNIFVSVATEQTQSTDENHMA